MVYTVIGLNSGTSADGQDGVLLETDGEHVLKILATHTIPYTPTFRKKLHDIEQATCQVAGSLTLAQAYLAKQEGGIHIAQTISEITDLSVALVTALLEKAKLKPSDVSLIGDHGQTIYHHPGKGISIQLQDGATLAQRTGITVINDFRSRDIQLGGQGAPLAPLFHHFLAQYLEKDFPVAIINCGGISNITHMPNNNPHDLMAFDMGPGNNLIDRYLKRKTDGKVQMDQDGLMGMQGRVDRDVLAQLAQTSLPDDFLIQAPPKALDINELPLSDTTQAALDKLTQQNACRTLAAFTAQCIATGLKLLPTQPQEIIFCGGGAKNKAIITELKAQLTPKGIKLTNIADTSLDNTSLEAQLFAYLAVRALKGLPLSLPNTTGVAIPSTGGRAHLPPKPTEQVHAAIHVHRRLITGYQHPLAQLFQALKDKQTPLALMAETAEVQLAKSIDWLAGVAGFSQTTMSQLLSNARHESALLIQLNTPPLSTEAASGLTTGLAEKAQNALPEAIKACMAQDHAALKALGSILDHNTDFPKLIKAIESTFAKGAKVCVAGCGASGRLSELLAIELRLVFPAHAEHICSLVAGGDFACVRPVEKFEDSVEAAVRQFEAEGLNPATDLLITCTASGGAAFIHGLMTHIADQQPEGSGQPPWIVICNDPKQLTQAHISSQHKSSIFAKQAYTGRYGCLGLDVGPNALAGSSRMQSATVTQLAIYFAASAALNPTGYPHAQALAQLSALLDEKLIPGVAALVEAISEVYQRGEFMVVETDRHCAFTCHTDAAEQSPTFGQNKPENPFIDEEECTPEKASKVAIAVAGTTRENAFEAILGRPPAGLNFADFPQTHLSMLAGFDMSADVAQHRASYLKGVPQSTLKVCYQEGDNAFHLSFQPAGADSVQHHLQVSAAGLDRFMGLTLLKMILNMISTLVHGRLKHFDQNTMAQVQVSNNKLFARAVRLSIQALLPFCPYLGQEAAASWQNRTQSTLSPLDVLVAVTLSETQLMQPVPSKTVGTTLSLFQCYLERPTQPETVNQFLALQRSEEQKDVLQQDKRDAHRELMPSSRGFV